MTHSVHQHWDPLKVCAVGRSFPPEFYKKIGNPKVRSVMERIAIETEEDYQKLIKILEKFKGCKWTIRGYSNFLKQGKSLRRFCTYSSCFREIS